MKIFMNRPGERALSLNSNEILDFAILIKAFRRYGASPGRARELCMWYFFALERLFEHNDEIRRKHQERGKRLGMMRAAQLKQEKLERQQRTPKA